MPIDVVQVQVPGPAGPRGPQGAAGDKMEIRSDVTGGFSYIGRAPLGTLDSANDWTITKIALTGAPGSKVVATGAVWNDRFTEVYA